MQWAVRPRHAHPNLSYVTQFSEPIHPFIIHVKDVQTDENYEFRAVADMLEFGEDKWAQNQT